MRYFTPLEMNILGLPLWVAQIDISGLAGFRFQSLAYRTPLAIFPPKSHFVRSENVRNLAP